MALPYHLGAKAIAARLGYKSTHTIHKLMLRDGLPMYKRRVNTPTTHYLTWCISESALTAWELAKGAASIAEHRAKARGKGGDKRYALAG